MNAQTVKSSLTLRSGSVGVLSFAMSLGVIACSPQPETVSGNEFRDDLNRVVRLDGTAQRIVSLSPAITELLFTLDAGDRVVGRTQWDVEPNAALEVQSVGDGMPPNVEAVAAVNPDLVVFYASEVNRRPIEQLETLGIPSVAVKIDLIDRLPNVIRLLGQAVGHGTRADSLADLLQTDLVAAASGPGFTEPVRVVILTWDNPPIVIGAGSFLHEMITLAGAENAFGDIDAPSATVSIEAIAERDPDVFLVTTGTELPAYSTRPEWQTLRAVAERRFAFVEGTAFQWPTIRSLDAIPQLRNAIVDATQTNRTGRQ